MISLIQTTYYVLAEFDEDTNLRFSEMVAYLKENNIPPLNIPAHITLGGYENIDLGLLKHWVTTCYHGLPAFEVNFNHLGLFANKVFFVAPYVSAQLIDFHSLLHREYESYAGSAGANYTVACDNWVPHCSLAIGDSENVFKAASLIGNRFNPFYGRIIRIAVYDYISREEVHSVYLD